MARGIKTGGRQKGSQNKSKNDLRELLDKTVDFNKIFESLTNLALGIEIEREIAGKIYKIKEKPDAQAAKILLEYRYGKPAQTIEHSGQITEIQVKKTIITKNAGNS